MDNFLNQLIETEAVENEACGFLLSAENEIIAEVKCHRKQSCAHRNFLWNLISVMLSISCEKGKLKTSFSAVSVSDCLVFAF